jgi:hypothetical protein
VGIGRGRASGNRLGMRFGLIGGRLVSLGDGPMSLQCNHHGGCAGRFATRHVGSVRPGYNILAVSYNSDSTSFVT